ncbi:hypothetical protein BJX61DRAFT_543274 [Aspergillus egyptiacus]|nr:hypothetical protein BJX61DRAFT_543274 [Aspergillus egyptiacus]
MGADHHVKSKYVFRLSLPLRFRKKKQAIKEDDCAVNKVADNEGAFNNVAPALHVRFESEVADSESDGETDSLDIDDSGPQRRKRLVRWDGVKENVCCRWTPEHEKKLIHAQAELERCQKAWSSEQDIWLEHIEALEEEKEAYEHFLNNRAKHIGDEQRRFRKAWARNRRRSEEDQRPPRRTASLPLRLSRLRGDGEKGESRAR